MRKTNAIHRARFELYGIHAHGLDRSSITELVDRLFQFQTFVVIDPFDGHNVAAFDGLNDQVHRLAWLANNANDVKETNVVRLDQAVASTVAKQFDVIHFERRCIIVLADRLGARQSVRRGSGGIAGRGKESR